MGRSDSAARRHAPGVYLRGEMGRLLSMIVLAGCSGAADPGGAFDAEHAGVGSGTLRVEVRIAASPLDDESALAPTELGTRLEVDVSDASGAAVTGATVTIGSPIGTVTLIEGGCTRAYCGSQSGYGRVFRVSVARGTDYLDDVVVRGPSFHLVTEPEDGATVDGSSPLAVAWSPSAEADRVEVRTREMEHSLAGDPGVFEVPAGTLATRADQPEEERVRIRRERRLALTGGIGSSVAAVEIRNGVALSTMPAP